MTAALVKDANRVSPRQGLRLRRYSLRAAAAKAIPRERVATCGQVSIAGHVDIRNAASGARYAGLATCGSVWHCPVCAAKIAEARRQEVEELIKAHVASGGYVAMGALTIPHHAFQTARQLKRGVASAWRKVIAGAPWQRLRRRADLLGMVRALEVTHGENGWHPHLHVLFFFPAATDWRKAQAFGLRLFRRWRKAVKRMGFGDCNRKIWRFEKTRETQRAGDYVTKWGADRELTQGHTKIAKGGGRSPWQILDGIAAGSKRDVMLFREYAAAFKGARQLTWSRGLRERYGLRDPASDDDAALFDPEEDAPLIGTLANHVFRKVVRRGLTVKLLEAVEARPCWEAVVIFLRSNGVDAFEPPPGAAFGGAGHGHRSGPPRDAYRETGEAGRFGVRHS